MHFIRHVAAIAAAALAATSASAQTQAFSDGVIRIGVMNDRSGPYASLSGEGSAVGARMAAEALGSKIAGVPVEIIVADHQNKADIGAAIARKWFDADGVDVIVDVSNSAVSLAIAALVKDRKKIVIHNSGTTALTGASCTLRSLQWMYNGYATAASVVTKDDIARGLDNFFIIAVDYALGSAITKAFKGAVAAKGGKIVGEVLHPLNAPDFSSYLLQAQTSGAKAILLANGGQDLSNAVRQAVEFQLTPKVQLMAGALTSSEIDAGGLAVMQGLRAVSFYEWNRDDQSRNWAKSFAARADGRYPVGSHASTYSQVRHYLEAVQAAGTDDADAVLAKMREAPINDAFTANGHIREDGQMIHDMYLVRVKAPAESEGKGDYTRIVQTIPGDAAFQSLAQGGCPLAGK